VVFFLIFLGGTVALLYFLEWAMGKIWPKSNEWKDPWD
jgi:hypothetical protein